MSVITTGSFPKALWPGVKAWWDSAAKAAPQYAPLIFKKQMSEQNYEEYVQAVGMGVAKVKPEGGAIEYGTMKQGFVVRGTNVAYGNGIIVTHEELKDNRYLKLTQQRITKLRRSFDETRNIVAVNILNRAFNSSYTGGDGVSLVNAAHPNFSGGSWSNRSATDAAFSQAALEDLLIMAMQSRDDKGYIEPLMGNKLIVHPSNFFAAQRVLKTDKQTGNNFNDINPINTQNMLPGGIVSCPYLTASGPWFITTNAQDGLIWQEREALQIWEDNDFSTRNYRVAAYERYAFLWVNPRAIFGSNAP